MIKARNKWIRAINTVIATLALAEVDEETQAKLLGPIRAAERAVEQRGASNGAEEQLPGDPPAPELPAAPPA
jgi:hypothetical protein